MAKRTVVTLPGDGIGGVVLPEAIRVLEAAGFDADYVEAGIGWAVKLKKKGGFIGRDALAAQKEAGLPRKLLGLEVEGDEGAAVLDPGLGLPVDFAYQVITQVGNYGEIFDRHLAPLGLERGVNALWSDGGLMYSPPYR